MLPLSWLAILLQTPLESATHCWLFQMFGNRFSNLEKVFESQMGGDTFFLYTWEPFISQQYIPAFSFMPSELRKTVRARPKFDIGQSNSIEALESQKERIPIRNHLFILSLSRQFDVKSDSEEWRTGFPTYISLRIVLIFKTHLFPLSMIQVFEQRKSTLNTKKTFLFTIQNSELSIAVLYVLSIIPEK